MNTNLNHFIISSVQINYSKQPVAVFLLGANGSGKSSLRSYLNLADVQSNIDPDSLNRIAKYACKQNHQIYASKQAIRLFANAIDNNLNVCMESTLAGRSAMQRISQAKNRGYFVVAYFVGLCDVSINIERVKQRVALGGHDIERDLIIKRYKKSIDNLLNCYQFIDELHVIDNSNSYYELQFSKYHDQIVKYDLMSNWAKNIYLNLDSI